MRVLLAAIFAAITFAPAANAQNSQTIRIDCKGYDVLKNTGSSETLIVQALDASKRPVDIAGAKRWRGVISDSQCDASEYSLQIKASGAAVRYIRIMTTGEDAFWLDQLDLAPSAGGPSIGHWGANKGQGYCLSTDSKDHKGTWGPFVGARGCNPCYEFNVASGEVENCPARNTANDLVGSFKAISASWSKRNWKGPNYPSSWERPGLSAHIQGVARVDDLWVLSHNRTSDRGFLIWGKSGAFKFWRLPSGRHPGGIHAADGVIVVPVTNEGDPGGVDHLGFFQMTSNGPVELSHLRYKTTNRQAAGISYNPREDNYYVVATGVAVAGLSDNNRVYRTQPGRTLADPSNRLTYVGNFEGSGSGSGMQLIFDEKTDAMWLVT